MNDIIHRAIDEISEEYLNAAKTFSPFSSAHEGYAVILEELDELKEHVFKKQDRRDRSKMRSKAKQVAAMAMRFMIDVCGEC